MGRFCRGRSGFRNRSKEKFKYKKKTVIRYDDHYSDDDSGSASSCEYGRGRGQAREHSLEFIGRGDYGIGLNQYQHQRVTIFPTRSRSRGRRNSIVFADVSRRRSRSRSSHRSYSRDSRSMRHSAFCECYMCVSVFSSASDIGQSSDYDHVQGLRRCEEFDQETRRGHEERETRIRRLEGGFGRAQYYPRIRPTEDIRLDLAKCNSDIMDCETQLMRARRRRSRSNPRVQFNIPVSSGALRDSDSDY